MLFIKIVLIGSCDGFFNQCKLLVTNITILEKCLNIAFSQNLVSLLEMMCVKIILSGM